MSPGSAGHVSVRVEGLHPDDIPFLFEHQPKRVGLSFAAAAVFELLLAILVTMVGGRGVSAPREALPRNSSTPRIVWIVDPGDGGGGGGGGNRMPEPARQSRLPGGDRLTVPARTPAPDPATPEDSPPVAPLIIPAQPLAAADDAHAGILDQAAPAASASQGSGSDGGAGTGSNGGVGPGFGLGLGPGTAAGVGDGPYRPGNGVTPPVEVYVPRPQYTADAMRARVQGRVWVECIVQTSGICANAHARGAIADPRFGLDQEALKAAQLFRFRPGLRKGEPVPVLVTIELTFSLH